MTLDVGIKPTMLHKTEFLAALRSDRYQQAPYRLRTDEGYCCLGVACDLVDPNGWRQYDAFAEGVTQMWSWRDTRSIDEEWKRGPSQTVVMGHEAMEYLGMRSPNPTMPLSPESREQLRPYGENTIGEQGNGGVVRQLRYVIDNEDHTTWSQLNDARVPFTVLADIFDREYDAA